MPLRGYQVLYRHVAHFPREVELFLYPYQLLAFLTETTGTQPLPLTPWLPLSAIEEETLYSLPTLKSNDVPVETISSLLDIVEPSPTSSGVEIQVKKGQPSGCSSQFNRPHLSQLLITIMPLGPFRTFAMVLQDMSSGGLAMGLLELVLEIKGRRQARLPIDTSVTTQTMRGFFLYGQILDTKGQCASEIIFVAAAAEVLRWERDSHPDEPCPIDSGAVSDLLNAIYMLENRESANIAERLLGGLSSENSTSNSPSYAQSGIQVAQYNWDTKIPSVVLSSSLLQDKRRTRTGAIFELVKRQRMAWQNKRDGKVI
ncbi:hypothetical protein DXG01_009263 [Tephrocybe rancida]|nr:hypothetical protein DXG01_009263 [Tephrocybe rancida]